MKQETILAVVQKSDHSLGFYRIADGVELGRVALGHYPHEFTISPNGEFFYISEYGVQSSGSDEAGGNQVAVFSVAECRITRHISCGDCRRPHGIACDRNGALYVLCERNNRLLIKQHPHSGGAFDHNHPTGGEKGHMLALKADGSRAFFMNIKSNTVTTVDLQPGASPKPQVVCEGNWPEGFCFNHDQSLLYVGNRGGSDILVIDTVQLKQIGSIPSRPTPLRMTTDQQGRIICVHFGEDRSVAVINPASGGEEHAFEPPAKAVYARWDSSGKRMAFSLTDDTVQIYDAETWRCTTTIPTRAEPDVTAFLEA